MLEHQAGAAEILTNVVGTVFKNKAFLDAVCAKTTCPGTLVGAIDFYRLPEKFRGDDVRNALLASVPKVCVKNCAGEYCLMETVADVLARDNDPGHNFTICSSGCYAQLTAPFIDTIEPVIRSVTEVAIGNASSLCMEGGTMKSSATTAANQTTVFGADICGSCC